LNYKVNEFWILHIIDIWGLSSQKMEIGGLKLYHNLNVSYWTKSEFDTDMAEQSHIKSFFFIKDT
jgi:hypothetical protein